MCHLRPDGGFTLATSARRLLIKNNTCCGNAANRCCRRATSDVAGGVAVRQRAVGAITVTGGTQAALLTVADFAAASRMTCRFNCRPECRCGPGRSSADGVDPPAGVAVCQAPKKLPVSQTGLSTLTVAREKLRAPFSAEPAVRIHWIVRRMSMHTTRFRCGGEQ